MSNTKHGAGCCCKRCNLSDYRGPDTPPPDRDAELERRLRRELRHPGIVGMTPVHVQAVQDMTRTAARIGAELAYEEGHRFRAYAARWKALAKRYFEGYATLVEAHGRACNVDALTAERDRLRAELAEAEVERAKLRDELERTFTASAAIHDQLRAELQHYRDGINWETNCLGCAGLLTKLHAAEADADAEYLAWSAEREALRERNDWAHAEIERLKVKLDWWEAVGHESNVDRLRALKP